LGRDRDLIVFVNDGCVRSIEAVECALNCGKFLCRDEMKMRRQRPVGQIERVGVAFLDEGATHGSVSGVSLVRALPLARRCASTLPLWSGVPGTHLVRRIPLKVSSSTRLERRLLDRSHKPSLPVFLGVGGRRGIRVHPLRACRYSLFERTRPGAQNW
jgi:hypothetical protein